MSDPKGPFEAAVRAGCESSGYRRTHPCIYPHCGHACHTRLIGPAVLAAALPPDPAPETEAQVEMIARALAEDAVMANIRRDQAAGRRSVHTDADFVQRCVDHAWRDYAGTAAFVRRVLRASLLPGEEPSLCDDCPPDNYPTDKTRCLPCPRRHTSSCLTGLAANEACRPDDTLKRCTICGFVVDTQYAAEKPTTHLRPTKNEAQP